MAFIVEHDRAISVIYKDRKLVRMNTYRWQQKTYGGTWQVQIRRDNGIPMFKQFPNETAAFLWVRRRAAAMTFDTLDEAIDYLEGLL